MNLTVVYKNHELGYEEEEIALGSISNSYYNRNAGVTF